MAEQSAVDEILSRYSPPVQPEHAQTTVPPRQGADHPQLDWLDRAFLGSLSLAENLGLGGTPLKLYNDVVQRRRSAPITERDFSPDELSDYSKMVMDKYRQSGRPEGSIDYPDYQGRGVSAQSLGGFRYAIGDDGRITITDNYDFNTNRGSSSDRNAWVRALASLFAPRNAAAGIGRLVAPPGQGVPVRMELQPTIGQFLDGR